MHGSRPGAAAFADFGTRRLGHLEGLDGLRGLAVLGVICFHGNWGWMKGGYLGVSLFFTLSGFLITSLLLVDLGGDGVDLRRFWARRFRRLLPAAWLTLAAVLVAGWFLFDATQAESARLDVLASLAQVANWRFLLAGESYGDLFAGPSPVLHFWSLSIEEQFYLLFPLVLVGLGALVRGRRAPLGALLAAGAVLSWVVPVALGASLDRIYYGTDTRAGELLAGAVLAVVLSRRPTRVALLRNWWARLTVGIGGAVALVVTVVAWITVSSTSTLLTSGGLALVSLLSCGIVVAAAVPYGPVRVVCGLGWLRWVGRVSYGAYLFHWPLFVFLDERRTGLPQLPRFALVVALTFVLAGLSHRYVEQPIRLRQGWWSPGRLRPAMLAPIVVVALVAASLTLSPSGRDRSFDFETAEGRLEELSGDRSEVVGRTVDPEVLGTAVEDEPEVPPAPAPAVSFFGDSVMLSLGLLVATWSQSGAPLVSVPGDVDLGCGIARGGDLRVDTVSPTRPDCDDWGTQWPQLVAAEDPDVAILGPGQWELVERRMEGDDTWRRMGDPLWDEYLRSELLAAHDAVASNGALVIWLTLAPYGTVDLERRPAWMRRSHQREGVDRLNQIVREVVAARPDNARLVDLAAWMEPHRNNTDLREDGSHYEWTAENPVVPEFLGPEILRTWSAWWTDLYELARDRGELEAAGS